MKQVTTRTFEDNRSNQIVFISHCLLNQNCRYPGIAIYKGIVPGILDPLLNEGIGIEQLPCLECMGWGGVSRNALLKFFPIIRKYSHSKIAPILKAFGKIWFWNYKRVCKKEAKKIARQIKDYVDSGYKIVGLISMNDSPTCGVTQRIDLLKVIFNHREFGINLEDLEYPTLERMREIIPKLLVEGPGIFMRELLLRLKKLNIDIKVVGFNPWNPLNEEIERCKDQLFIKSSRR